MASEFPPKRAERHLAELAPGTLIGGYRIEGRVGVGGMATVYRAREEALGRPVALKVLRAVLTDDTEFRERFIRESRAASAVDHPNIIPVHAAGEDGGYLYLAMRYVAGGDLHSVVEREGALPTERAMSLLTPIASALDAAHGAGIVHRDVKPGNILIDHSPGRSDHPYLSDFGLAKGSVAHTLTNTGEFVGTAGFASPEQLSGRPVTHQTDQYALACVAFTVLTASLPFRHGDPEAALWAQMSKPPPRVTDRRPDLFVAVDDVLARALSRDPAKRYASCGEFAAELGQALVTPSDGGRLPAKRPAKLPGRLSEQVPAQPEERQPEPPQPPGHARLPGEGHARLPGQPGHGQLPGQPAAGLPSNSRLGSARSTPAPVSTAGLTDSGPMVVPLHGPPGHHRRTPRKRRRPTIVWTGAVIVVVAAVAAGILLLTGGKSPDGADVGSTGPVDLNATLPTGASQGPVTIAFGQGGTLTAANGTGKVSTFSIASQHATGSFSPGVADSSTPALRLNPDGSTVVQPAALCGAGGAPDSCDYAAYGIAAPHPGTGITGGAGPDFSVGDDTMADADARGTGVDVWSLKADSPVAKGLTDPDHGSVNATAIDPSGAAVAASSAASGPTHHVYWWALHPRSLAATETVPTAMGAPWATPGVAGLPMGLAGQTLALSDGETTDIYRAQPGQAAQAQTYPVPGGLMAVSPANGDLVATVDQSSAEGVDIWNARTGQRTATLSVPAAPSSVAFSPDGNSVAVGCANGDIYVWTITGS